LHKSLEQKERRKEKIATRSDKNEEEERKKLLAESGNFCFLWKWIWRALMMWAPPPHETVAEEKKQQKGEKLRMFCLSLNADNFEMLKCLEIEKLSTLLFDQFML